MRGVAIWSAVGRPGKIATINSQAAPSFVHLLCNLKAVAAASGGSLADAVKLNIYLIDLANFAKINEMMAHYFQPPNPPRAAVGVKELPRCAPIEADAVLVLG